MIRSVFLILPVLAGHSSKCNWTSLRWDSAIQTVLGNVLATYDCALEPRATMVACGGEAGQGYLKLVYPYHYALSPETIVISAHSSWYPYWSEIDFKHMDTHQTTKMRGKQKILKKFTIKNGRKSQSKRRERAVARKKPNSDFGAVAYQGLNFKLYPAKPKQVEVSLPILWDSLKSGVADLEMKKAVTEFAKGLTQFISECALFEQALMKLDPSRKKVLESLIR